MLARDKVITLSPRQESTACLTWNLRLVYWPPGISWLYTSEEQDRRSLSNGAYSALVPCSHTKLLQIASHGRTGESCTAFMTAATIQQRAGIL